MLGVSFTKKFLTSVFNKFGYVVENSIAIDSLRNTLNDQTNYLLKLERAGIKWNESGVSQETLDFVLSNVQRSYSQIGQDLFVLLVTNQKQNGFFVEFGATDGKLLSNTFLLEDAYHWNGILAEPARVWHTSLHSNRKCVIDTRCVYDASEDYVLFKETESPELSVVDSFKDIDLHREYREQGINYQVQTVTLMSLLAEHDAPVSIDYLSIDTEGNEFSILKDFDFEKYTFGIITVEHNYTEQRQQIFDLLNRNGYVRVFEKVSDWDDWYIHVSLQQRVRHLIG